MASTPRMALKDPAKSRRIGKVKPKRHFVISAPKRILPVTLWLILIRLNEGVKNKRQQSAIQLGRPSQQNLHLVYSMKKVFILILTRTCAIAYRKNALVAIFRALSVRVQSADMTVDRIESFSARRLSLKIIRLRKGPIPTQ